MTAPTMVDLEAATEQFFGLHWGIDATYPCWNFSWKWRCAVPNYHLGGLYALFAGNCLIYVGLAASRGSGNYQGRGISRRLMAHVLKTAPDNRDSVNYTLREHWRTCGVDLVATIGFPAEYDYLAPALEDFLIGKLNPPENTMKRRLLRANAIPT